MEDQFVFDVNGILPGEDSDKFFEDNNPESPAQESEQPDEQDNNNPDTPAEVDENQPEEVGNGEGGENGNDTVDPNDGSSPTIFSSIAGALKKDGIFPDFDDETISGVKTAEDFAELFNKAIRQQLDEQHQRVLDALDNGVKPDMVRSYEQTLSYLGSIDEDALKAEGDEGDDLRKQLIFNDALNRGYSKERAAKIVERSFSSGSDVDDAREALDALKTHYTGKYDQIRNDAKKRSDEARLKQQRETEAFKKLILEDEVKLGDTKLDKRTCQKVFDAVMTPVYKDPETGRLLTAVQKFQKENPNEFQKQLGMWFVLTDGGKNIDGFLKEPLRRAKNSGIRELEHKINTTQFNPDGSVRVAGKSGGFDSDSLLSDGWQLDGMIH